MATAITGTEDAGHDAVQEGFAAALRHRTDYRGDGPLEAWVWRAVVNAALKARGRRAETLVRDREPSATNGTPGDDTGVRSWIASLPERQRVAIFLRYYADLDYRSIAEALGVEVGTVSATLSSAHSSLRQHLKEAQR